MNYLGAGALGTFIVGSFARPWIGYMGMKMYGVPVIPTMDDCFLFSIKYFPNNDHPFFSLAAWFALGIQVFPIVAFAATFGRLYQEVFMYVFKGYQWVLTNLQKCLNLAFAAL